MSDIMIELLREEDAEEFLLFETENRAFFERTISGRGDAYYQLDNIRAILRKLMEEREKDLCYMYLIRNRDREIVGRVNLVSVVRGGFQKAELGYRIGEKHNGKGCATQAVRLAMREAFHTHGLHRVEASTAPDNIGSQIVLIKNGFQFVGRSHQAIQVNGEWCDSIHFEQINQQPKA